MSAQWQPKPEIVAALRAVAGPFLAPPDAELSVPDFSGSMPPELLAEVLPCDAVEARQLLAQGDR